MPFTPKSWLNLPATTTPLSGPALTDLEIRVTDYADDVAAEALFDANQYTGARETFILNEAFEADDVVRGEAQGYAATAVAGIEDAANAYSDARTAEALARWHAIMERHNAFFSGTGLQSVNMLTKGSNVLTPATTSGYTVSGLHYYNPADHVVPGYTAKMRLRTTILASETALNTDLTFGIAPVTALNSTTSGYGVTLGANIVGTTYAHGNGLVAETSHSSSVVFDAALLTTGLYAITVIAGASVAGTTAGYIIAGLDIRNVPS